MRRRRRKCGSAALEPGTGDHRQGSDRRFGGERGKRLDGAGGRYGIAAQPVRYGDAVRSEPSRGPSRVSGETRIPGISRCREGHQRVKALLSQRRSDRWFRAGERSVAGRQMRSHRQSYEESLTGQRRSLAFANLLAACASARRRDQRRHRMSAARPASLSAAHRALTAGEWNRAAASNNRVSSGRSHLALGRNPPRPKKQFENISGPLVVKSTHPLGALLDVMFAVKSNSRRRTTRWDDSGRARPTHRYRDSHPDC